MTPTRIISALTLALLMSAGVASAQSVNDPALAATTVNTTSVGITKVNVDIKSNAFDPHNVVVSPGTTITWTNRDTVQHSLIADNGAFTSGAIAAGGTFSHVFATPGTYVYYDSALGSVGGKGMFGDIVVLPAGVSVSTNTTSVPGIPNTGSGGSSSANGVMLAISALVSGAALLFLRKRLA